MDVATFASFAVGPASLALLGYQSAKVGWLLKRLREGDFVHRGLGTTDLLPYALPIEDGIVLDKNGALTASWLYTAPDTGGLAPSDINEMAERTNGALKELRAGWMLQSDLIRGEAPRYTPPDACHFTDPVCASIDEERRLLFERAGAVYQGYTVLTLSYLPTRDITKHFLRWIAGKPTPTNKTSEALADFRAKCSALEKDLAQVVTTMQRLGRVTHPDGGHVEDEQLRFINFCVTGVDHPIRINPANPLPMDALVGTQDLYTKPSLRIGDQHVRCVTIDGFPESETCWPTQLNLLCELGHPYRWNTRFIFLDPEQAQAELQRTRDQWKGQTRSLRDQVQKTNQDGTNVDAEKMVSSAEAAINSSRAGLTANGYYTSAVIVMHQNAARADYIATEILAEVRTRLGFSGRIENFNALETFLGSLPSDSRNIRRPHVDTDVLANLMPLTSLWVGSPTAPCSLYPKGSPNLMHTSTHGSTPHWLNCHVGDVGHTLIFGPTRAGKSVLINMIMAQLRRYEGMKIFAFDIGLSMYALTRAIHATTGGRSGQHYRPGEDNGCPDFAPLHALDTREDRAWAQSWIKTILELNGVIPTPAQLLKIEAGLEYLAKTENRSMSELVPLVQAPEIRTVLRQYTRTSGGLGAMFDAKTDALELSDFSVFEIGKLMKADARFVIPALLYLFRRIENAGTGPKAFVLDEGWAPLSHPQFRSRAEEWFKTAAKANCAVILGTQSVGDVAKSGIFETLNEQCFNKIFLPNKRALSTASDPNAMSPAAIYRSMGLTDHQIHQYIVNAVRQKQYYQFTPDGNRLFELDLGPFAKAFVAQTNIAAATKVMALEAEYGHEWVDVWLQDKGLHFLAEAA